MVIRVTEFFRQELRASAEFDFCLEHVLTSEGVVTVSVYSAN